MQIGAKSLQHKLYVIPDLNEPLILGINFIQLHQVWYCPKNTRLSGRGNPIGAQGTSKSAVP
jgi:hypothetical protein